MPAAYTYRLDSEEAVSQLEAAAELLPGAVERGFCLLPPDISGYELRRIDPGPAADAGDVWLRLELPQGFGEWLAALRAFDGQNVVVGNQ